MLFATIDKESKASIVDRIRKIRKGGRYTFFSNGIISSIEVLNALILGAGEQKVEIIIATWQLGIRDAGLLLSIARGENTSLKILLDVSYKDRNPKYFNRIKKSMGEKIWLTSNHTKVMLIMYGLKKYTVLSSANFNRNFRFEFFDITESEELYEMSVRNYLPFFKGKPIGSDKNERPEVRRKFESEFSIEDSVVINENCFKALDLLDLSDDFPEWE